MTYKMKDGKKYIDFIKENNLSTVNFYKYTSQGHTPEEAINMLMDSEYKNIGGTVYKKELMLNGRTLKEMCKERALSYNTVYGRIKKGLTIEEAINYRKHFKKKRKGSK